MTNSNLLFDDFGDGGAKRADINVGVCASARSRGCRRRLLALVAFAAIAVTAGCADEPIADNEPVPVGTPGPEPEPSAPSTETRKLIGTGGGRIELDDGFVLRIPAGALAFDVELSVALTDSPPGMGPVYVLGPEGQSFDVPVSVTVPFDPAVLSRDVHVFTAPRGSSDFTSLGGVLVDPTHVRSETTHFSLFGAKPAASPSTEPQTGAP